MTRQLKQCIVALAASVAAACLLAPPAGAYQPRVPETFFGVSAPEHWFLTGSNRNAERDRELDGMKAAGIDWVRVELGWPEIEPQAPVGGKHTYRWDIADRLVTALATRGMELMALPMNTPGWAATAEATAAGCGRSSAVARTKAHADFVGAIAARYGVNGSFWSNHPEIPRMPVTRYEIGNEANWDLFWCPGPDPERYGTVARGAAEAIHALDPKAEVILGGLIPLQQSIYSGGRMRGMAADEFIERAVAHEPALLDELDAVAFHPYDSDPAMSLSLIGWMRQVLNRVGLADAKIVLTEFGWLSGGLLEGVLSELLRTKNYNQLTSQLARTDCGITAVAAHTWASRELDLLDPNHWYGIASPITGLLYPSGVAYRDQVALFEGRGPTPAPRQTIRVCGAAELPDQDGDGVPDEQDDYPLDAERSPGSGDSSSPGSDEEPRTRAQRIDDSYFGVGAVQLPTDFNRLGTEFEAMAGARIGTMRLRIDWSYVEPVARADSAYASTARWAWLDRVVLKAAAAGIRLHPSFGAAPAWTSANSLAADYAEFMGRFARRYGRGGSLWAENRNFDQERLAVRDFEVWQHGNQNALAPFGTASASQYAQLYLAARSALRAVDDRARAVVSVGEHGQAGRASDFIGALVSAAPELRGSVDAVLVMAEYSRDVFSIERLTQAVRYALNDTGTPAAPIYLGFGAPTSGANALTEADRAALFTEVASRAPRSDCGVEGLFAHAWTTPEQDAGNPWHWFGIADPTDATLSPTAEAYRDVAAAFRGYGNQAAPTGTVIACGLPAPDRDGDGTPDTDDPAPLDPAVPAVEPVPPPAPVIKGGPASSPTASRTATFSLAGEGASGFECSLDGATFTSCGASPSFTDLTHGPHELRVRAFGDRGVVGEITSYSWVVDIRGPEVTGLTGPGGVVESARAEFRFSADESPATFYCKLDGGAWVSCASPQVYSSLGNGAHEFRVAAVDQLDNVGSTVTRAFTVDVPPPVPAKPQITGGPGAGETTADTRPVFQFSGEAASYACRMDAEAWRACSGPRSDQPSTELASGPHVFAVVGVNNRGVAGPVAERTFNVDAIAPDLRIRIKRKNGQARTVWALMGARDASGVGYLECRLNRTAWRRCGSPERLRRLASGRHQLRVKAVDSVGNISRASKRWRVASR